MINWGTGLPRRERRSTRVPWETRVEIASTQSVGSWLPALGKTTVVNLHGALIRTSKRLPYGENILMMVFSTRNLLVEARIVYSDPSDSRVFGVELFTPGNIWGISNTPADWKLAGA